MNEYIAEGKRLNLEENIRAIASADGIEKAMENGTILEARATVCDSGHNLIVDLGCMKGVIPRKEGAVGIKEGTVRDIAVISRVGKAVSFLVDGFFENERGEKTALLSRAKAQQKCLDEYISTLSVGDVTDARVTHLEAFGAFCDIGCGVVALMPIDAISVSRIEHPDERFETGMDIKAVIKSRENGRISLSHKELLGTWEENAAKFSVGETVTGVIRSVENYGAFVELTPNLAGLAELKDNLRVGDSASVYIKSIIPEKMKIKLIIIDAFPGDGRIKPPEYFITQGHIDRFLYSPPGCSKSVCTDFGT